MKTPPPKNPHPTLPLFILLILTVLLGGCELFNSGNSGAQCISANDSLSENLQSEGTLTAAVEEDGPYPMAIVFSQDSINRLFAAVAEHNLPALTLADDISGIPIGLTIRPSLPLIEIGKVIDCPTCILTSMDLGIDIDIAGQIVGADGIASFSFPLELISNGLESTRVMGGFQDAQVLDLKLALTPGSLLGFEDIANEALAFFEADIEREVGALLRSEFSETELFELEAWEVGDGNVKLLGRGPIISPENKTIVIGMHSNLYRPLNGMIDASPTLPEGADVGLQFHPELIQRMVQRMMFEGHIDRSYELSGEPSAAANNHVTLDAMKPSQSSADLMTAGFTLWRTGGGFCGLANLQADLGLSISDRTLSFSAQNVQVTGGEGTFGDVASFAGEWADSPFLKNLIDTSQLTVNYNTLKLPNDMQANMGAESFRLDLGSQGLRIFLNIDQIVSTLTE